MYDLIIIGAGPAGYVAAVRAGALGKKVLVVEKSDLGGVCLNSGCIPTKSFLYAAKIYDHAKNAKSFGVNIENISFDYEILKKRTEKLQANLRNGISGLMKKYNVEIVKGRGKIKKEDQVEVEGNIYSTKNILLCTGTNAFMPPINGLKNNDKVVDNKGILALNNLPESVGIIGGGVIGVEFANFFAMLGKKVTVIEMLPQICGSIDRDMSITLRKKLESKGVDIYTQAKVNNINAGDIVFTDREGNNKSITADVILVATGRDNNIKDLGLENIGVEVKNNSIQVNEKAETNVKGIYAAGDITGKWQLAHFASRQAVVAVNNMFGREDICRENAVPAVIYTDPEIATIGLNEEQAKSKNINYKIVKMPLNVSGRFLAENENERGFVKAVLGAEHEELLGMQILGNYASEIIATAAVMIETELKRKDIQEIIFPHPTIAEVMKEIMF